MSVEFIIQSKCKDTLKDLAKLALNNRLYVAGWELSYQLQKIIKDSEYYFDNNYKIYLYYKDDKPVSIFLYSPLYDSRDNCMAFTRKSERRNSYNTALIKSFTNDNPDIILKKYYFGIKESEDYFKANGII